MLKVGAPYSDTTYADRLFDCKLALAPAFLSLASLAQTLGWRGDEIALALSELAESHLDERRPKPELGLRRMGVHLVGG